MSEPAPLVCDDNLPQNWVEFKEEFMAWLIAEKRKIRNEDKELDDNSLVGIFVSFLGSDGRRLFRTLVPNKSDLYLETFYESLVLKEVWQKFDIHCKTQTNYTAETHVFNQIQQDKGEPFAGFLTRLRTQVVKCGFKCACGESTETRALRDRIVEGVCDRALRLKLIGKEDLTEESAIVLCKNFESAKLNIETMEGAVASVAAVEDQRAVAASGNSWFKCGKPWDRMHRCEEKMCFECKQPGHFARNCPTRGRGNGYHRGGRGRRTVNAINEEQGMKGSIDKWIKELIINDIVVNFKIDTGAQVDIIPKRFVGVVHMYA